MSKVANVVQVFCSIKKVVDFSCWRTRNNSRQSALLLLKVKSSLYSKMSPNQLATINHIARRKPMRLLPE